MIFTNLQKDKFKQQIKHILCTQNEIKKIIVFGSFITSNDPNDIDVAVFQDSDESYLSLAMKYRKLTREISKEIPLDIIPLKIDSSISSFFQEIEDGELIYEK